MGTSSAGGPSPAAGKLGRVLYRVGGVLVKLIVMWSVTVCINFAVSPTPFSRTQGISARDSLVDWTTAIPN